MIFTAVLVLFNALFIAFPTETVRAVVAVCVCVVAFLPLSLCPCSFAVFFVCLSVYRHFSHSRRATAACAALSMRGRLYCLYCIFLGLLYIVCCAAVYKCGSSSQRQCASNGLRRSVIRYIHTYIHAYIHTYSKHYLLFSETLHQLLSFVVLSVSLYLFISLSVCVSHTIPRPPPYIAPHSSQMPTRPVRCWACVGRGYTDCATLHWCQSSHCIW